MPTNEHQSDPPVLRSGFADLVGYRVGAWENGRAEIVLDVSDPHLNRSGIMHGGVLSTLVDVANGYAGCHCTVPGNARRSVTLQLTTQFLAPVRGGTRIVATGRVVGGGGRIFFSTCEVHDEKGTLVGRGEGVFKYRPGSEKPEGQPIG